MVLTLAYVFQRRLIYLPSDGPVPPAARGAARGPGRAAHHGGRAHARRLVRAGRPALTCGYTVLVANGNGGDRSQRADLAAALRAEGLSVLLFDYRGYGGNPGDPTEDGLALDVRAARDYLVDDLRIPRTG